jgi:threonylcarbamoyladenosine tRNA methylthiotransferase MtaB
MNTLLDLDKELEEEYKLKFVGEEFDVIIETYHDLYQVGHTSNYLEVNILYNENLVGNMVKIKITKYENNKLYGELIN